MNEPLPIDVRLMNAAAAALLLLAAAGALVFGALLLVRHPAFNVSKITVLGDTQHNSSATLRANVLPKLSGNFFTLDLRQAQRAFEQAPWVRSAVVQRDFPNRLKVKIEEHEPMALLGAEADSLIVNKFGEVFVANAGDITQALPRLIGPEAQAAQMLRMVQSIEPLIEPLDLWVEQLELSGRSSWRATLDNGAVLELGRGDEVEVLAVLKRFTQALTSTAAQWGRSVQDLEYADLRYPSGFALRMRGVSIQTSPPASPKR
jgi:cell division protein FtsQ